MFQTTLIQNCRKTNATICRVNLDFVPLGPTWHSFARQLVALEAIAYASYIPSKSKIENRIGIDVYIIDDEDFYIAKECCKLYFHFNPIHMNFKNVNIVYFHLIFSWLFKSCYINNIHFSNTIPNFIMS